MKNRLYWILTVSLFLLISWGLTSLAPAPAPNIIVLLADDMRFDALGFTGNRIAKTPNLDALANQGTYFRKAFVTTSICAISRACIFSGQFARRHGINDFQREFTPEQWKQTYPMLLRGNGYYTGFIGKFGVGVTMPESSFDFWRGFPGQGYHWMKDEQGKPIHSTDWMGQQMLNFLANRDRNKPFCLSVSFKAPHAEDGRKENGGFLTAPRFDSLYQSVMMPQPLTNQREYYTRFPEAFRHDENGRENEGRVRWQGRFDSTNFQNTTKSIYRLVSGIDEVVGQLVETLRKQGLLDNTIIVFTSDNGFYQGEHGFSDKWYGHNESIRVPLLIVDGRRRLAKRQTVDAFALNIDLAPTLLTYAGVKMPTTIQGKPLQPLIDGKQPANWRKSFYYDHRFDPGKMSVYIPMSEGIVTEQYKYIRYFRREQVSTSIYEELFAWSTDSLETNNLISRESSKPLYRRMERQMTEMRKACE